jgi:hypothetical protein
MPLDHQALVGRDAPQDVEQRRDDQPVRSRPPRRPCRDRGEKRRPLTLRSLGQRRIGRGTRRARIRRDVLEDPGGDVGDALEPHAREVDPGLLLETAHDRVAQRPLVREVPVHRALVHAGALGHRTERQGAPVVDRRAVQEVGAGGEDSLARLRRLLAAQRGIVRPASSSVLTQIELLPRSPEKLRRPPGSRRSPPFRAAHRRRTGSVSQPRTVEVEASLAFSRSTSHSGKRFRISSRATRPSRRARDAPRQKWVP